LVERWNVSRDYSGKPAGKPTWDSIDLSGYLRTKNGGNRGLFLLQIREDIPRPQFVQPANDDDGDGGSMYGSTQDNRLILVTDLGMIVKRNKDGSQEVFVQSIHTGVPVDGTRVSLLGQNGEPVASTTTDVTGHATLPKFAREWKREKLPETILVEKGDDFSFLPLRSNGRDLDVSRFDVGGAISAKSAQELSAYLFSDRGIYRPGETAHLEAVVRTGDWQASLAGLPVKFEISDSRGAVVSRNELKLSPAAFESIDFASTPEAPTGTYQAMLYLVKDPKRDELLGSTSFRVQEFEPDRMKVRLDLSDKTAGAWLRPSEVKGRVTASLLSGEPAVNRRAEGEVSLVAALPAFSRYPDYRFQVAEFQNEPYRENLAQQTTDDKGNATLTIDLDRFTGKAYRLSMLARIYEAGGGRNVAAQSSVIVSDSPWLVGIKPDGDMSFVRRDTARSAHWIAVNQQLDPMAAENLTLEWVQRKYVSVLTEQPNKTYKYVSRLKEIVRDTRKISIPRGGMNIPLRTAEPGDFVFVLRDSSGAEVNKLTWSVAGDANLSRSLDRNAELEIQLNKKDYAAGETIDIAIRAPYIGAGLITIERDKVYAHRWFKSSTTSSVQHIQVPNDFEGSGYVSVQFVRDPSSDEIFLSPLSWGVAPFAGNLAARTEPLTLSAPRQVKPGNTLTMHVTPGSASRVAVIAVDEGILQVARYRDPDPVGYFFQKRMLEVNTSQILDLILPEFRKFLALAAPGGDADGGYARHLNPFQRKRKPPVAWWSGIVDVGPAGRDFRYVVPDYFNGKVRIIAIAVSPARIGVQESGTEVKGDFLLTPNVPAVVGPGDEFIITSGVYDNTTGKGPIHIEAQHGPELTAVGPAVVDIDPSGKKEVTAEFRFRANPVPGSASIRISARRGAALARTEESVGIRPPVPFRTQLTLGRTDAASTPLAVTRNLYPNLRKVEAAVSTVPLVWGQGLILWLGDYPYLCTEQLASKGVGVMLSVARPEFGIQKPTQSLSSVISAIGARQNEQGGLGLWESVPETAEFPTIYAAQFLIEAKDHGQRVPPELLDRLNDWMQRFASSPAPTLDGGRDRAYAIYLLARQGLKPAPAISNVEQELSKRYTKDWPTDLAAAYLAATYRLLQRNDDAERIVAKVPWAETKTAWTGFDYYGPNVHNAVLLYLEAKHFPNRLASVPRAVLDDMAKASGGRGLSSLDAASILMALDAYAKSAAAGTKLGIAEVGRDGQLRQLTLPMGSMPRVAVSENAARLSLSKDGPLPEYYSLNESGFDRDPPTSAMQQGLEILHDFVDAGGNPIQRVRSGDEFFVRTRFRTLSRDYVSVAVVDMLPGGVEPVIELRPPADSTTAAADPASKGGSGVAGLPIGVADKTTWRPQFADVRDDRVVLYGAATKQTATFTYRVRATNPGTFLTPPAFAEGMYDRAIAGQSAAGKLEVTKP
ncbi:MAG TPA: alpha-2-macroglobulin, partial [Bryobacteraceae bacterium]|nr:alpha-2-macroglobulin [Bryobacteraceae bacterium]